MRWNSTEGDKEGGIIPVATDKQHEYRCPNCNALFFKGTLGEGTSIETQCRRCGNAKNKLRIGVPRAHD